MSHVRARPAPTGRRAMVITKIIWKGAPSFETDYKFNIYEPKDCRNENWSQFLLISVNVRDIPEFNHRIFARSVTDRVITSFGLQ